MAQKHNIAGALQITDISDFSNFFSFSVFKESSNKVLEISSSVTDSLGISKLIKFTYDPFSLQHKVNIRPKTFLENSLQVTGELNINSSVTQLLDQFFKVSFEFNGSPSTDNPSQITKVSFKNFLRFKSELSGKNVLDISESIFRIYSGNIFLQDSTGLIKAKFGISSDKFQFGTETNNDLVFISNSNNVGLLKASGNFILSSDVTETDSGDKLQVIGNTRISSLLKVDQVTVGSTNIDPSAALQVTSTTKGFLPPVMTLSNFSSISSAANGLLAVVGDFLYMKNSSGVSPLLIGNRRPRGPVSTINSNTTIVNEYNIRANALNNDVEITLPNPANCNGEEFRILKIDSSSNKVIIKSTSTNIKFGDYATYTILYKGNSVTLVSNGVSFDIF